MTQTEEQTLSTGDTPHVPIEKIVSLCKRRGFVYPNSEIYGGVSGIYDFGPLGVELRNNIRRFWWWSMVQTNDNVVGIEGAIITHPRVWEASGHVENFVDRLVGCKNCKRRFRIDHLPEENIRQNKCPVCGGELTEPRKFNLMMETYIGVVEGERMKTYLRGEACQNIYLDYDNVLKSSRVQIPFGICQIGKAFRNEVTPGNFLFRQREFEQWDLQFFVHPSEMQQWFDYWKERRFEWYKSIITHKDRLRFRAHGPDELAHYAKQAFDKEELLTAAKELHSKLRRLMVCQYDDVANIGRRYRRQDEIGTPFCVTIDFTTLEDQTVTVRERDSMSQIRLPMNEVPAYLLERVRWDYNA